MGTKKLDTAEVEERVLRAARRVAKARRRLSAVVANVRKPKVGAFLFAEQALMRAEGALMKAAYLLPDTKKDPEVARFDKRFPRGINVETQRR